MAASPSGECQKCGRPWDDHDMTRTPPRCPVTAGLAEPSWGRLQREAHREARMKDQHR